MDDREDTGLVPLLKQPPGQWFMVQGRGYTPHLGDAGATDRLAGKLREVRSVQPVSMALSQVETEHGFPRP